LLSANTYFHLIMIIVRKHIQIMASIWK
jgi:hypothetical protein